MDYNIHKILQRHQIAKSGTVTKKTKRNLESRVAYNRESATSQIIQGLTQVLQLKHHNFFTNNLHLKDDPTVT